jgi:hypothetical protein
MAFDPSITETQVFTALRAFILTIVNCEVVRGPSALVPMPVGDFVALQPGSIIPLSTNVTTLVGANNNIRRPSQFSIQVDCYGVNASDRAVAISTLLRSPYGCDQFTASGFDIQPLYAGDAHQMPLVDGESKYTERWTFDCVLQMNPVLTVPQQSATALSATIKDVDRTFPP